VAPSVAELLDPAQTNLRLYEQLRRAGRDADELAAVRRAYELAMRIFAGQYRATGKPFVAHLVGTAGILGSLGAAAPVVRAGLLHAAYTHGDFGGLRRALTGRKRAAVGAAAGADAEALILRYTELPWTADALPRLHAGLAALPPVDRDVVTMRLANELEDLVDLGGAYCGKADRGDAAAALERELAEGLGLPVLAAALAQARRAAAAAALPAALRGARRSSFILGPASHRERLELRVGRRVARLLALVRRW
jgi:hypothetical protein